MKNIIYKTKSSIFQKPSNSELKHREEKRIKENTEILNILKKAFKSINYNEHEEKECCKKRFIIKESDSSGNYYIDIVYEKEDNK